MIRNLREVRPGLWAGGQPLPNEWGELVGTGTDSVLKLNEAAPGEPEAPFSLGMRFEWVSIPDFGSVTGAHLPMFSRALNLVSSPGKWYFHCSEGVDRTGFLLAMVRVRLQGWSKDEAFREWAGKSNRYPGLEELWAKWNPYP